MKSKLTGSLAALLLLPILLLADVRESVDKKVAYRGDSVTYTLSVSGKDVEFPDITEIGGNPVTGTSSSQNISIINGEYEKTISKSYTFMPKASLEIPSYKVLVNGGVEMSRPVAVKIVEPSQDKSAPVVLEMRLAKKRAYVGEPVRFDLVFKQKPNAPVDKLEIEEPKFEDFWVKQLEGVKEGVDGDYTTRTYSYLLFAQRSGKFNIPAVTANVGQLDRQSRRGMDPFFNNVFGQQLRYSRIFSNTIDLDVEPLPDGLELYGDFDISVEADKTTVAANKPLNLTVRVKGEGNIEDVKPYSLDIDGAVIYANDPVVKSRIEGKTYVGSFEQKIVVIAEGSYTIKPFKLRYFDSKTHKEVVKETQPITVTVTGGVAKAAPVATAPVALSEEIKAKPAVQKEATTSPRAWQELLYAAAVGFGIGALFVWLMMRSRAERRPKQHTSTPMAEQIKKAKSDKALFELLLPYKKEDPVIEKALAQLEANLYRGAKNSVDKKGLISYFNGEAKEVELV